MTVAPELACSIATRAMLPEVRVLAASFRAQHPHVPFVVLITDDMPEQPEREPFELLHIDEVGISEHLRFRAPAQELSYLATPFLLRELLRRGVQRIVFFKQETLVCSSARRIFEQLRRDPIVLAPHLMRPVAVGDPIARERAILNAGAFNVGLLGIAAHAQSHAMLDWWADRVTFDSALAIDRGVHYEQRWLALVPSYFDAARIDRRPGTCVGHWSLPDLQLDDHGDVPRADGDPIIALRFSGFDEQHPASYSRWAPRLDELSIAPLQRIVARYAQLLEGAGGGRRTTQYAFARYDDGTRIPDGHRAQWGALDAAGRAAYGSPFRTGPGSFHEATAVRA